MGWLACVASPAADVHHASRKDGASVFVGQRAISIHIDAGSGKSAPSEPISTPSRRLIVAAGAALRWADAGRDPPPCDDIKNFTTSALGLVAGRRSLQVCTSFVTAVLLFCSPLFLSLSPRADTLHSRPKSLTRQHRQSPSISPRGVQRFRRAGSQSPFNSLPVTFSFQDIHLLALKLLGTRERLSRNSPTRPLPASKSPSAFVAYGKSLKRVPETSYFGWLTRQSRHFFQRRRKSPDGTDTLFITTGIPVHRPPSYKNIILERRGKVADGSVNRNIASDLVMEALDGPNRQSGILSIINRDSLERINTDRSYTSISTMAATAVVSPASMYSNGPPPPYSGWSATTVHSTSGLVSPPESRRTSDNKTEPPPPIQTAQPHRQSLPSIHEALGPKPNPYASPVSASLPPAHNQLPYSQPQGPPIPRSYPPSDHAPYSTPVAPSQPRQASPPQPVHPHSNPFARPEPPPSSFPDAARHPSVANLQNPPPHNPYPGPRYEPPRYEQDPRAPERVVNGYPHHSHPPPQTGYAYNQPPSHVPAPHEPGYNQARFPSRDSRGLDDAWKGGEEDGSRISPFKQGLKRRYLVWDFENYLSSINVSSSALQNWSDHFHTITQEQQPRDPSGVPDRMPTLESCNEMLQHQDKIRLYLEKMRDMISQQHEHVAMMDQHMREHGGKGPGFYDDEMSMYGEDLKNQGYGGPESKKRRGVCAYEGLRRNNQV
ncbi:hypothetical protein G7Y89_g9919 [Cudoniella acicularis]|uniref:Uncharacterized protein n=1 Tax=Cudoniella acicularis TaxID=354080 RepID=A0A8H4RHF5_9HELO|nr:hypothetical protein G7Y89_g9919 [Cudoniella acicularis]